MTKCKNKFQVNYFNNKNIIDNKNLELHEFEKLVNHRNLYGEYLKKLQKNKRD